MSRWYDDLTVPDAQQTDPGCEYVLKRTWLRDEMTWSIEQVKYETEPVHGQDVHPADMCIRSGRVVLERDARSADRGEPSLTESVFRRDHMVICGGGHVSIPIIRLARSVGFYVTVLEDRPMFADHARKAGADQVICGPFEDGLRHMSSDMSTWYVIVTRGHRYDAVCLEHILRKPAAYVGLMGSRRRTRMVKEQMRDQGLPHERIEGIYTPIGLDIGAETPEEISVSVIAEIISLRAKWKQQANMSPDLLKKMLEAPCVLTEIVERRGSAPRGVGAKMLVFEDGTTYDTIGGGCAESDVIARARLMIREKSETARLIAVDMTAEQAEDEGMVCGGVIYVHMEYIAVDKV